MQDKNKQPKKKINMKKIIVFFLAVYFIVITAIQFINTPISNIYVENNTFLSDQAIIEIAKVGNYPSAFSTVDLLVEKRLESNIYIRKVNVYKTNFTVLHIKVLENAPIFYNKSLKQTVLQDGRTVSKAYNVPTLINYVPDTIYKRLVKETALIDNDILMHISEIEYRPNEVDEGRFLLSMTDGNYVYLTLTDFEAIDDYLDIVKNFGDKKGILYLDSGGYFEIIER